MCRAATKRHSLISLLPPWPAPAGRPRPLPILQIRRRRHRAATPHAQVSSRWVRESEYEARPLLPPDPVTWLTCAAPRGPAEWGTVRTWGSRRELWSPPAGCASSSGPPSKGLLPLLPKRSWATSAPGPPPPQAQQPHYDRCLWEAMSWGPTRGAPAPAAAALRGAPALLSRAGSRTGPPELLILPPHLSPEPSETPVPKARTVLVSLAPAPPPPVPTGRLRAGHTSTGCA